MHITNKAFIFISSAFSVLLCAFLSLNASAADLSYNMNEYEWKTSVNLGTQYCAYSYDSFGTSPSICILDRSRPNMYGLISYSIAHKKDDVAEFYLGFQSNISGANTSNNEGLFIDNFGTIDDNYKIIGFENVSSNVHVHIPENSSTLYCDSTSAHFLECSQATTAVDPNYYAEVYKFTILYTTTGSHPVGVRSLNSNTPIARCVIDNVIVNTGAQCQVRIFGFTQWEYVGSDTKRAIDNQTQQQNNQYNQEKQEESQRESQANGDSSSAQSLFNFSVLNPFANLWGAFNSSGCVSIPTIASMLHSTNTTYCPWFPSNVRSVLTPVMAIASSMLLFGFVVRWLSGNSGDIYGARNMNKELNG